MLNPEELEVESLHLHMHENPELAKSLYAFVADFLDAMATEFVDSGALEMQPEQIINAILEYRDCLSQISAL